MTEVAPGIHRFTPRMVNWYLIEEDAKLTLVDAGFPRDWDRLARGLRRLGRTLDDIAAVVLTHAHVDHVGFAERVRTEASAPVHVHEADAPVARGEQGSGAAGGVGRYWWRLPTVQYLLYCLRKGAKRVPVSEVSTFADGEVLEVPGRPRVIHAPGHTAGNCALYLPDRDTLISGDVVVTYNILTGHFGPQIPPRPHNADTAAALAALARIENVDATIVLPGHGDPWRAGVASAVRLAREAGPS